MWLRTTRSRLIFRRPERGASAPPSVRLAPASQPSEVPRTMSPTPGVAVEEVINSRLTRFKYFHSGHPAPVLDSLMMAVPKFRDSAEQAVAAIEHGAVQVRGAPLSSPHSVIHPGERIEVITGLPPPQSLAFDPSWVVSEDGVLLCVNKPAGLYTTAPTFSRNLDVQSLAARDLGLPLAVSLERAPLDAVASGLTLLVTATSALGAGRAIYQSNSFIRTYLAACSGRWPFNDQSAIVDLPVVRGGKDNDAKVKIYHSDGGADPHASDSYRRATDPRLQDKSPEAGLPFPAATALRFVAYDSVANVTLVEALSVSESATGQIRAHLASVGLPVIGDVGNGAVGLDDAAAAAAARAVFTNPGDRTTPVGESVGDDGGLGGAYDRSGRSGGDAKAVTKRSSASTIAAVCLHAAWAAWPAIPGSPRTSATAPPPPWWGSVLPAGVHERAVRATTAPPKLLRMKALVEYRPKSAAEHRVAPAIGRPAARLGPNIVSLKSPKAAARSREWEKLSDVRLLSTKYQPPSAFRGAV